MIYENLLYFAALYEDGDIMPLSLKDHKVIRKLTNIGKTYQVLPSHDDTAVNAAPDRAVLAKWCYRQLQSGHVLKMGYDKGTGTYWGNIVS